MLRARVAVMSGSLFLWSRLSRVGRFCRFDCFRGWGLLRCRSRFYRLGFLPGLVRIEFGDLLRGGCGARTEILLVHHAVVVDDEAHHPRVAVRRRPGDERVAADHGSLRDINVRASRSVRTLSFQYAVVIPV